MLGSFEFRTDDGVLADVPGARLRGLLIALALEPGRAVPKAALVDWIWGERPPSDAANALQRLVSRTALPQHRTLRAVIDWSWELLTGAERMVLRRLAVFSGGASLDAAEQVCGGDSVEPGEVLEVLTALTEKSLLLTEGDSAPRYRTLDTIKEYARTGSGRRGNRIWRAMRISRTSPDSPKPRSRICDVPSSWSGSPRSRSSMTTSRLPCVARSRPTRRTGRCGSRRPPAGTGGSAGTRPRASS